MMKNFCDKYFMAERQKLFLFGFVVSFVAGPYCIWGCSCRQ